MSSRPQYGELASAEEQAAARGIPAEAVVLPPPVPGTATFVAPPPPGVAAPELSTVPRRPRLWDSLLTTLFTTVWFLAVFSTFADFANLGATTVEAMQ